MWNPNLPNCLCCAPLDFLPEAEIDLRGLTNLTKAYLWKRETLLEYDADVQIIITDPGAPYRWDKKLIDKFEGAFIITPSTGTNHIDVDYAFHRNMPVRSLSSWLGVGKITASSEYTWALMMALVRNIPFASMCGSEDNVWRETEDILRGREIQHLALGIIGMGRIGTNLSKYARAFGMKCFGYDPPREREARKNWGSEDVRVRVDPFTSTSRGNLMAWSDIICCCAKLTEETFHMIDLQWFLELRQFGKRPWFVNTSRGEIVDSPALIHALDEGWLRGAAVDVVEREHEIGTKYNMLKAYARKNPLKLIVTPHIAGATLDSQWKAMDFVVETIRKEFNYEDRGVPGEV